MVRILCIGACLADIVAKLPSAAAGAGFVRLREGSKLEVDGISIHPGGSACNSAATMSRIGAKATLLSAVGDDDFGKMLREYLKREGVDYSAVAKGGKATGTSIVLLANGEKTILKSHGAFEETGPAALSKKLVDSNDVLFVTSLNSVANYALFEKAVKAFAAADKPVVFAPSITMIRRHGHKLKHLAGIDLCVMNDEEAEALTGKKDLMGMLSALPGRVKVVTYGRRGAIARDGDGQVYTITPPAVKIADMTGAGDSFSGALAAAYYSGASLPDALRTAAAAACLQVTAIGANFDFTRRQVLAFREERVPQVKRS